MSACRLYLISPPRIDLDDLDAFVDALDATPNLVAAFQLRLKDAKSVVATDAEIAKTAERLAPLLAARDIAFIINDRPDLVAPLGFDGCHIGQSDGAIADARRVLGDDKTLGVTCHASKHLAFEAGEAGADYVAFGAFFPTQTKRTEHRATPDLLRDWQELAVLPCVAIGGITPDRARPLADAGADFLAVSSGVWAHPQGAKTALKAFSQSLNYAMTARV